MLATSNYDGSDATTEHRWWWIIFRSTRRIIEWWDVDNSSWPTVQWMSGWCWVELLLFRCYLDCFGALCCYWCSVCFVWILDLSFSARGRWEEDPRRGLLNAPNCSFYQVVIIRNWSISGHKAPSYLLLPLPHLNGISLVLYHLLHDGEVLTK